MNKILVTNIQHFCLHDGQGIRTTVFLKGCFLKCPWCANPENISNKVEYYIDSKICIGDKIGCKYNKECKNRSMSDSSCKLNAIKRYGNYYSANDLYEELIKDKPFYINGGGVTFSGGEPLMQINEYIEVLGKLKNQNINVCMETSLFAPSLNLELSLSYFDEYIVDVKLLDKEKCKAILNGNLDLYLSNIKLLFNSKKKVIYRIPLSYEYSLNEENLKNIERLIKEYPPSRVEIFKLHNLAKSKYERLNKDFLEFKEVSDEDLNMITNRFEKLGVKTIILKI